MMKKRILSLVLAATMAVGTLAGCGASAKGDQESEKGSGPVSLTVWHDGDEAIMKVIEDTANKELEADQISLKFEKKTGLTDQLKLYGSDEQNGPDMYLYAHDSLGTFAEMDILAPVTDFIAKEDEKDLIPMTVDACTYKGTQYQLPLYFESLLFMYNKDLWQGDVPDKTDDLLAYMEKHTDVQAGTYALLNQHSTAYNVAPIINGYGAEIISKDGKAGLDSEVYKEALAYNQKFAALQGDGDYNTIAQLFNEGKAQAIIGGPWLVSGIKDAGINLGIRSLSSFTLPNGKKLAPYSGVQGIGILKYAEDGKKEAIGKALKALMKPELGQELAKQSNCAPANNKSYEDQEVAANEMIMAIKETAETAQPMPNIPQMSVMWGPAEEMLAAVNKNGTAIDEAAKTFQQKAETAIKDMQ